MKLSLRNRFLLPTLLLIILGMGISTAYSFISNKKALAETAQGSVSQLARSVAGQLGSWLGERQREISIWARDPMFRNTATSASEAAQVMVSNQLELIRADYPFYELLVLGNATGMTVAASDYKVVNKVNASDRSYFKASMGGRNFISEVIVSRGSGRPVFVVSSPVKSGQDVVGVFFGLVDLTHLTKEFVDEVRMGESGYAYVVDGQGQFIAHPDKSKILAAQKDVPSFVRSMLERKNGILSYEFEGTAKQAGFASVKGVDWVAAVTANEEELFKAAHQVGMTNTIIALAVVAAALLVIFLVARSLVGPLNAVAGELSREAAQVAEAAGRLSVSSQSLAAGASQQAASLEESSASLEELASMTATNAENARAANGLMGETALAVEQATASMKELKAAMDRIKEASQETAKIIKTIDEIAFQTNLLALNAAVEAARAGEAGAGFAVVAEEVRNLAMRAAEAARNTSGLLEDNVRNIGRGAELVGNTDQAFDRVGESTGKVKGLVGEITQASQEQAQGLGQLNQAMAQMDKVTQESASGAEQSASAAEELTGRAGSMLAAVERLEGLVGSGGAGAGTGSREPGLEAGDEDMGGRRLLPWRGRQS